MALTAKLARRYGFRLKLAKPRITSPPGDRQPPPRVRVTDERCVTASTEDPNEVFAYRFRRIHELLTGASISASASRRIDASRDGSVVLVSVVRKRSFR